MGKIKYIRVACVECDTPANYRAMRQLAAANERTAGAKLGLLGEFLVSDEYRFGLLKQACNAKEITMVGQSRAPGNGEF